MVKYLTGMGELSRKDNSLCYRKDGKNIYIPIEGITEIYCLNEVSINTKLLDFLSRNKVTVHFFNYYEGYAGTFYPKEAYLSGRLFMGQVKLFENNRLRIAKNIVKGIGYNIKEVLYHYYRHGKSELKAVIDWIANDSMMKIERSESVGELMLVEGEIWMNFYDSFKYFLPDDFIMNKRVRRPPDNPINALISFGNSILYSKTVATIYKTHLDQRISFLHEPTDRRFSLSLDLCEVFKPIIVFKCIFELVNNKKLSVEKHFDKNLNYCVLNDEGRKIFVTALEARLDAVFQHPILKRRISYKYAIQLDCYKLEKDILEGKEFIPFRLGDRF